MNFNYRNNELKPSLGGNKITNKSNLSEYFFGAEKYCQ